MDRVRSSSGSSSSRLNPSAPEFVPAVVSKQKEAAKVVSQVEYYLSDLNLATTDHLMRFISQDAEGYVPISVVAGFKKIKAVISGEAQLATVLRNSSSKLVVSEDGKRVRRLNPITESDIKELQSRIMVAEKLREEESQQKLIKKFSGTGSRVKTMRRCNGHAYVEYETVEDAEKAVSELTEKWRSGPRVRLFMPTKPPFDESIAFGRGKGKPPPGPRMPDGTRGFSLGRGNPL